MGILEFFFGVVLCLVVIKTSTSPKEVQFLVPETLLPHMLLFRGAVGSDFLFTDDNAPHHHTVAVEEILETEDIQCLDWPETSQGLNPIVHM